jgi:hypothetical protein
MSILAAARPRGCRHTFCRSFRHDFGHSLERQCWHLRNDLSPASISCAHPPAPDVATNAAAIVKRKHAVRPLGCRFCEPAASTLRHFDLLEGGTLPLASLTASSFAQKCMQNSRGSPYWGEMHGLGDAFPSYGGLTCCMNGVAPSRRRTWGPTLPQPPSGARLREHWRRQIDG